MSSCDEENDINLPNGLYCGCGDYARCKNIFRQNKFIYQSKNNNYKQRLPGWKTGDILLLSYNSALNSLSFFKENDNNRLNSFIKHLPSNQTFYWFVGHSFGEMSMTIVD